MWGVRGCERGQSKGVGGGWGGGRRGGDVVFWEGVAGVEGGVVGVGVGKAEGFVGAGVDEEGEGEEGDDVREMHGFLERCSIGAVVLRSQVEEKRLRCQRT